MEFTKFTKYWFDKVYTKHLRSIVQSQGMENKRLTVNGRLAKQDPSDTKTARQIYDGFSAKGKGTMQANT